MRVWEKDHGGELDAPVVDALSQPAGNRDAIVEIASRLLGRRLLYMSRDALKRDAQAPQRTSRRASAIF